MLIRRAIPILLAAALRMPAQDTEAGSGFDLRATFSGVAGTSTGDGATAGYRAVLYPVWKLSDHWSFTAVYQLNSAYLYPESGAATPYVAKGFLLQGSLNYSLTRGGKSLTIRAGELSTAFGSFMTRYDDAVNWFTSPPQPYGYYYAAVSTLALTGVQADFSAGRWDARAQLSNSSPENPRSPFGADQYGNWTGGGGYTFQPGFRIGASAFHGPYLDRLSPFFWPGESPPAQLKATAWGIDGQWGAGHWNLQGEWQKFTFPYRAIPTFREQIGYLEAKRVLSPRWYAAARAGFTSASFGGLTTCLDTAVAYRPAASMLVKFDYEWMHGETGALRNDRVIAMQFVTTVHPISFAFR